VRNGRVSDLPEPRPKPGLTVTLTFNSLLVCVVHMHREQAETTQKLRHRSQQWHTGLARYISVIYIGYISDISEFEYIGHFRYFQNWIFSPFFQHYFITWCKNRTKMWKLDISSFQYCVLFNFKTFLLLFNFRYFQNWTFSIFFIVTFLFDVETSLKCENRHIKFSILLII